MQADENIRTGWSELAEHGDVKSISEKSGISRLTIGEALATGTMSMRVFEAIQGFYNDRKAEIERIKKQA